jgi:hypothetical protein
MNVFLPEPSGRAPILSRRACLASGLLNLLGAVPTAALAEEPEVESNSLKQKQRFSGQVVLVREALARRDIKASGELDGQVALETESGELLPIVPDWRGRAFFQDKRLRERKVDLIGFKTPELPYLQVLTIYAFDEQGQRQYVDYWCDICAIPMYEIQQCQCCQGDIELRFQPRELPKEHTSPDSATLGPSKPSAP